MRQNDQVQLVIVTKKSKDFFCLGFGKGAKKKLQKVLKLKEDSQDTKKKIICMMVFWIMMCGCENWTAKKPTRKTVEPSEMCSCITVFQSAFFLNVAQ